jgi:hypothetical protein
MARSNDYVLTEEHWIEYGKERVRLPEGAFVRPVELQYLPKHIVDCIPAWYDHAVSVYCYTRYGFTSVNRLKIRQV